MTAATLLQLLTSTGLIAMMLSMGFKSSIREIAVPLRNTRLIVNGLLVNFVMAPAATGALLYAFDADPFVSAGFLILAVCPGAPVGPPITAVAKGDVSYATGLMLILAGLSAILSPALLRLILPQLVPADDLQIDYLSIVQTLLITQLLPLGVGLIGHQLAPRLSGRIAQPLGQFANVLLLGVVVLVFVQEYESLSVVRGRGWVAMAALWMVTIGLGWIFGGPLRSTRRALAVTTAVRNAAVALVIVTVNFAGTAAVTAVIAYSLVSIFATIGCALALAKSSGTASPN
jgi:BASS family bile acid:Na+ symporter